jgi:hypothetical protein
MYRQIEILAMGETPTRRRVQFPKDFSVEFWVVLACGAKNISQLRKQGE